MDSKLHTLAADNLRILAAAMVEKANSGHPGGAMGGADFVEVLYSEFLNFDPDVAPRYFPVSDDMICDMFDRVGGY